jgi:hypothetical protein
MTSHIVRTRRASAPDQWQEEPERFATGKEASAWESHLLRVHSDIVATRLAESDQPPNMEKFDPNKRKYRRSRY